MFGKGYRLPFQLMGIPVYLDVTFLIVLPLFVWIIGSAIQQGVTLVGAGPVPEHLQVGIRPFLVGLFMVLGLFASVVLHELGHAVTARRYGVRVRNITLWLLGGVAQFEEMPRQRGAEAVVAIVGPIVSVALGLVLWLISIPISAAGVMPAVALIVGYLAVMNVVLAVFNMLPALPLDGGRVLRSLLALRMNHLRATQVSAGISKFFAVALGLFGLLGLQAGGLWLIILAIFIYMAVTAETQSSLITEMLEGVGVRDLMEREVISVPPEMPVQELTQMMLREHHLGFPVIDQNGQLIGLVSLRNVQGTDPNATVGQIMEPQVTTIRDRAGAVEAFQLMTRDSNFGRLIVVDDDQRIAGIITKTDLMRAIKVRSAGLEYGGDQWQSEHVEPALGQPRS